MTLLAIVIGLVITALIFDFINGFHDAANSIATIVSTRVLSPGVAVAWAAFFNFIAAFFGSLKVANTMGKGVVEFELVKSLGPGIVLSVVFAALVGAIAWNLITWWKGLPSSSSHALVGGLIGATLPLLGFKGLVLSGILKILVFIVLAPVIGFLLGSLFTVATSWIVRGRSPAGVDKWFRRLQLVSAGVYSFSHGTNDAQKVMGIISVILFGTIWADREFHVPFWVVLLCHGAIAAGTLAGGWRIVKTMGHSLTKIQPIGGFCAETGGGVTILWLAHLGIPVSTTHTITGAIVGVGATNRLRSVRWGVAGRIIWAWVFTIPISAAISAGAWYATRLVVQLAT